MATYRLRFRFHVSQKGMITGNEKEIEFTLPNQRSATRHCTDAEKFSDSTKFVILSGGYSTEGQALEYAGKLKDAVLCFGAKFRLGVDVGKDKASGHVSKHVKDKIFDEQSIKMIDDVHGITAYSEDYPTSCVSISSVGIVSPPRESSFFTKEVCKILETPDPLGNQIKLAMELLTSSYFESSPRARFLTLVLAAESILAPENHESDVKYLIDEFIEKTKVSDITSKEKQSVLGSLNWLYKDSISQSLRKMASKHLPEKTYGGLSPEKFISKCYDARSKLVHTGSVENSKYNIGTLAANLEVYMTDMLTTIAGI